jgi:hypothetical protein
MFCRLSLTPAVVTHIRVISDVHADWAIGDAKVLSDP